MRYPCDQCDFSATRKLDLKVHVERIHEGVRYPCDQCEYVATTRRNLKAHIECKHEQARFQCDQCEFSATRKWNLKAHKGVRYPCVECDYVAPHVRIYRILEFKQEGV